MSARRSTLQLQNGENPEIFKPMNLSKLLCEHGYRIVISSFLCYHSLASSKVVERGSRVSTMKV